MTEPEIVEAINLLADMATSSETPGVHRDDKMDALIMAARNLKQCLRCGARENEIILCAAKDCLHRRLGPAEQTDIDLAADHYDRKYNVAR